MHVKGTPMMIDGKTGGSPGPATATRALVAIPHPLRTDAPCFTRALFLRHYAGAGNLRVYLPMSRTTAMTIKPTEQIELTAQVTHFWVEASAGTVEWEAIATVAG